MSRPVIPPATQPSEVIDLGGGPHSEPYRPFTLPGDQADDLTEAWRHERILEQATLGGFPRYSSFTGYSSDAGPTPQQQAYARALQGGLPDDAAPIPEPPKPFKVG